METEGESQGVTAESILRGYREVRPAVIDALSNPDAANRMAQSVFDIIEEGASESQLENAIEFALDLPEDVFMGFISRVNASERVTASNVAIAVRLATKEIVAKIMECGGSVE